MEAPKRLPLALGKENAELDAAGWAPNRLVPKAEEDAWLAPKAGADVLKLKVEDCAPNAGVLLPKRDGLDAPKAGVDCAPKLKAIAEMFQDVSNLHNAPHQSHTNLQPEQHRPLPSLRCVRAMLLQAMLLQIYCTM